MEDIHIINLFLERSEDAIRQVEVKYEKFCFKIAWNILYNTEDSEECVNDTWLITWNKIPPKTPTKLSAFLGKITRNLALDNFRKKNASKRADTHDRDYDREREGGRYRSNTRTDASDDRRRSNSGGTRSRGTSARSRERSQDIDDRYMETDDEKLDFD